LVLFIYKTSLASNEIFSSSNKIITITVILPTILLYTIPTITNNKEIIYNTIIENGITTTTTVIYNQIIGTITKILVLYILLVVNIINVSKGPLRHKELFGNLPPFYDDC